MADDTERIVRFECAARTDVGKERTNNEDALLLLPEAGVFAVADGMGGHSRGEVAARLAVDTLGTFLTEAGDEETLTWPDFRSGWEDDAFATRLAAGLQRAHVRIAEESARVPDALPMGTTLVALQFVGKRAYVAHVGDSRCYRFSRGKLTPLTADHTLVRQLRDGYDLSEPADQFLHQLSHILVRALGTGTERIQVDLNKVEPLPGDLFLLCTDGLNAQVPDDQIREVLGRKGGLEAACTRLVDLANEAGGKDNVTVVVVRYPK
jgi:protein phosphatase